MAITVRFLKLCPSAITTKQPCALLWGKAEAGHSETGQFILFLSIIRKHKIMKVAKIIICIFLFNLCIFLISASLVLADQSHGVDAYVTDWRDTTYLIKNVRSDFQPNDSLSFYAYYGVSTLTIPFSSIKRIIVTDRTLLTLSEDFSEAKHYSSGEIILTNDELLQCHWISHGWKGYNKYDGLISIEGNSWKEIKFRGFDNPKKGLRLGKQGAYPYTIHVSSYRNKHVAYNAAIKLREKGSPAFVCPVQLPIRGEFYRIFIGFYSTFRETRKAALKLKGAKDLYPLEAKMPYAIQVGTFNSDQNLKKVESDLQSKTYLTYAVPDATANHRTKLLFGAFRTAKEASIFTKMIQNDGFEAKVVTR
jgi:SPOR domain